MSCFSVSEINRLIITKDPLLPPIYILDTLSSIDLTYFKRIFDCFAVQLYLHRFVHSKESPSKYLRLLKETIDKYKIPGKFKIILYCVIINGSDLINREILSKQEEANRIFKKSGK